MTTKSDLQTLSLTAVDLRALTDWDDALILDYLSILQNMVTVSDATDENIKDIDDNKTNIEDLTETVEEIGEQVDENTAEIQNVYQLTQINAGLISPLRGGIEISKKNVAQLAQLIGILSADNSLLRGRLNRSIAAHNDLESLVAAS